MKYALVGVVFAMAAPFSVAADDVCISTSKETTAAIAKSPSKVLEIVERLVSSNEGCSCEVVKAAIIATEANKDLVAQIVETAAKAAPDKLSIITTCALAVAPDAQSEIVAVASKLEASAGDGGYSAKGGKVVALQPALKKADPRDFPGVGVVGPESGSSGGAPLLPLGLPPVNGGFATTPPNSSR